VNVTFHALASFGIGHAAARHWGGDAVGDAPANLNRQRSQSRDARVLLVAFVTGVLSHGVLDGLKHGYPIPYALDPPLALVLVVAWLALVERRYRALFTVAFVGAILPDVVDLGPSVANRLLGWHLPTLSRHVFPWHRVDGSGSMYPMGEGVASRPGHGNLDAGDNQAVSIANHAIVVFFAALAILANPRPLRFARRSRAQPGRVRSPGSGRSRTPTAL
jgi:hypothetical protein